jgi:uncharacterized NAD(P)/FAD-binding protein YdhS
VTTSITIVGGGAAGVLTALHLLREPTTDLQVTLIEKGPRLGEGIAYATCRPEHLLNVVASRMSAIEAEPDHLVRWLAHRGASLGTASLADGFAARRLYADYLRDTLHVAGPDRLTVRHDTVIALQDQGTTLHLDLVSGGSVSSDVVVLALGNWARSTLHTLAPELPPDRLFLGWDHDATAAVGPDEAVCIVGTGLSMVDAVLTLAAQGHREPIHVVSRHGLLPLPHAPLGKVALDVADLVPRSLRVRMRTLRAQAIEAQRAGHPWQWVLDTVRPHIVHLWQTLGVDDQRRFLRHVARYWDVHRHRIPAPVAAQLQAMREAEQLHDHRARPVAIAVHGTRLRVVLDQHGAHEDLIADRVIDCTGMQPNLRRVSDPLVCSLLAIGRIRPGAHGIGLDTDATGAVVAADGEPDPRLYAIGSVRRGQLWESIAVPELRQQAAALARTIITRNAP